MVLKLEYPGPPVPWARAGTKHGRYYTPEKQQEHRKGLAEAIWLEALSSPDFTESFDGPLGLEVTFEYSGAGLTIIKLEKLAMANEQLKTTRPDLDNLVKQVMEALEDSGLIENDKQIASLFAEKIK